MAAGLLRNSKTLLLVLTLSACAAPVPVGMHDPNEVVNRRTHEFNKSLDRSVVRPVSGADSDGQHLVAQGFSNLSENLGTPGFAANDLLQARPDLAVGNILRFAINSTIGVAGLFDPASAMGLNRSKNGFGQTLHVWGMGEGAYVELPFLGPSTERDMLGEVGDTIVDPLGQFLNRDQSLIKLALRFAAKISDRGRFGETFDSVLYDSADSYAQARLLYLQNRRHELGQSSGDADFEDPYEDPYAE
jgi:phospholipid-binding lipoprotein MlaA